MTEEIVENKVEASAEEKKEPEFAEVLFNTREEVSKFLEENKGKIPPVIVYHSGSEKPFLVSKEQYADKKCVGFSCDVFGTEFNVVISLSHYLANTLGPAFRTMTRTNTEDILFLAKVYSDFVGDPTMKQIFTKIEPVLNRALPKLQEKVDLKVYEAQIRSQLVFRFIDIINDAETVKAQQAQQDQKNRAQRRAELFGR